MEIKSFLKIVFISIIISLAYSSNANSSTISGFELQKKIEVWLKDRGKNANIAILEQIKYPYCDNSKLLINDISGNYKLIKVNCVGKNSWQFIVRNKINEKFKKKERINKKIQVIALKNSKNKDEIISEEDLVLISKKGSERMYVTNKKDVIGKKLTRSLRSKEALKYSNLKNDWLIEKNAIVTIINNKSFITIKEEGLAMDDANFMEKIRVKNIKSGKIIEGYAKNKKKVILNTKQN